MCQLLDSGKSGDEVANELMVSFADFQGKLAALGGEVRSRDGWRQYVQDAVVETCPEHLDEIGQI